MNFIEMLEYIYHNTNNNNIKEKTYDLLKAIKRNMSKNPHVSSGGMGDRVIIKVQRGDKNES